MNARSDRVIALGLALVAAAVTSAPLSARARADEAPPETAPDPLNALRARFRAGLEKYEAGAYADAILVWEGVYRELGAENGYRLAFNLARAYEAYGDPTRAAERYEAYVQQVSKRRAKGEGLERAVLEQERDAKERLALLAATRGRIHVIAGDRPTAVAVDAAEPRLAGFVAYVSPGRHVVTFGTGEGAQRVEVVVTDGEMVEMAPPQEPPPKPARPRPAFTPEMRTERPFPTAVLFVAGAAVVAAGVLPIVTYTNASAIKSDYDDASRPRDEREQLGRDYEGARDGAYASMAVAGGVAAVAAGLVAWYFLGTTRATATPIATPKGAFVGGRF